MTPFAAVGLELWSMTDNIYFDNFFITNDEVAANKLAQDSWSIRNKLENANTKSADSVFDALVNATREKPWLWALYVLVVLVPVVLVVVFCCGKSSKTAEAKKTDAVTKDDQVEQEVVNEDEKDDEEVDDVEEEVEEEVKVSKEDLETEEPQPKVRKYKINK